MSLNAQTRAWPYVSALVSLCRTFVVLTARSLIPSLFRRRASRGGLHNPAHNARLLTDVIRERKSFAWVASQETTTLPQRRNVPMVTQGCNVLNRTLVKKKEH